MGLALACAGPTAAPTVTELIATAAAMATRVRLNCDDIFILPLFGRRAIRRPMPIPNQDPCQLQKTAKNWLIRAWLGVLANQELGGFTKARLGKFIGLGDFGDVTRPKRIKRLFTTFGLFHGLMARSTWGKAAMIMQLTIAIAILFLLAFAPPARGEMLLIPLDGQAISPALLGELPLVTERPGPTPGSLLVFGSSEGQLWRLLKQRVLILSAPRPTCRG